MYLDKKNEYFEESRLELMKYYTDFSGSILDIGCGKGGFANSLKKLNQNIEIWGVEPNIKSLKDFSSNLDFVIQKKVEDCEIELEHKKFDIISFNDVLEHIDYPENTLNHIKQYLKKDGKIYASVPNFLFFPNIYNILINQDWKYTDSGILDKTHLRFYTKKSIERLFNDNGFEIEHIETINPKTFDKYYFFKSLNVLFFNKLIDWRYLNIFVIAKLK